MNRKSIKDLSEVELKALAYDELAKIEMAQANLRSINLELSIRSKVPSGNGKLKASKSRVHQGQQSS